MTNYSYDKYTYVGRCNKTAKRNNSCNSCNSSNSYDSCSYCSLCYSPMYNNNCGCSSTPTPTYPAEPTGCIEFTCITIPNGCNSCTGSIMPSGCNS